MKLNILFYTCIILVALISCKSETQTEMVNEVPQTKSAPKGEKYEEMIKDGGVQVPEDRIVIKDSPSGDGNYNWTFLTKDILHFRHVVSGNDVNANPKKNHWIDLKDDGSYATGILSETSYSGKWSYNHPKTELTLVPDPTEEKNSQWNVKFNEDMLVWIGTQRYADNATQMQLVRRPNYPGEVEKE